MNHQPKVREPVEKLNLQSEGFLDAMNGILELRESRQGLSEGELDVIGKTIAIQAHVMRDFYEEVIRQPMPNLGRYQPDRFGEQ